MVILFILGVLFLIATIILLRAMGIRFVNGKDVKSGVDVITHLIIPTFFMYVILLNVVFLVPKFLTTDITRALGVFAMYILLTYLFSWFSTKTNLKLIGIVSDRYWYISVNYLKTYLVQLPIYICLYIIIIVTLIH